VAKDRHSGYTSGDHWAVCDICGVSYRQSDLMDTWDGLVVCARDYEGRHGQDLIKAKYVSTKAKGNVRTVPEAKFTESDRPSQGCTNLTSMAGEAIAGCATAGV